MKKAVLAVLFHCIKFDRDKDTWCKYHFDKLNNTTT